MGDCSMRNRFPSKCYRCGETVKPDQGTVEVFDLPGTRWSNLRFHRRITLVEHDACASRYAGTNTHWQYAPDDDFQVIE